MTDQLKQRLKTLHEWLRTDKELWDIITASRGPDAPSERGDMSGEESTKAYAARRARKYKTVEVIRAKAFPGVGGARYHDDDHVILPKDRRQWDHFDGHVAKAAHALGLKVEYE